MYILELFKPSPHTFMLTERNTVTHSHDNVNSDSVTCNLMLCSHNTQSHRLQPTHCKLYSFSHIHQIRLNKCNNLT